ncbi:MAG TPA: DUF1259 domain-containing protein [Thermoanaerobaculia bacterium]|jgi:hypothetical protein|nr:DUF1259 domain-containing protein [Thermoanaerobaculia bacterium]
MRLHTVAPAVAIALAAALPASAQPADPLWTKVDAVFGAAGKDLPGGVHRFGWPRRDLHVRIGEVAVEPALALGSWGAFIKAGADGAAMAMGDLVLLESELSPVVSELETAGIEVAAIHNHLIGESPHVVYVHFSGHGDAAALATGLKQALARTATPLAGPTAPISGAAGAVPASPAKPMPAGAASDEAFAAVERVLGRKGTLAGAVLQLGVPRAERIEEHGMEIPPAMGMANALNFQRVGNQVATTGDFVLIATEVNPVIRELRAHGLEVTALHSHMLAETPRLFFMHFWGVGSPETIAGALKAALSKVNTKP